VRQPNPLRAGWILGESLLVEDRSEVLDALFDRFALPAGAGELRTIALTSSMPMSSTARDPSSGTTRPSATRWSTRVPSLTSTRDSRHRSQASASVGFRVIVSSKPRSGTRRAASSPLIHRFRSSASRFVLNEPPYRVGASRPPARHSTR
jgi:hypothetical protein